MKRRKLPAIAVVGAGRLGRALAMRLAQAGATKLTLVARSAPSRRAARAAMREFRRRFGPRVSAPVIVANLEPAVSAAQWILLAVPDPAIAGLARELAALPRLKWRGRVVLHHAGALGPADLAPLAARGAATGVLHPLEAFPRAARASEISADGWARIEGDAAAMRVAAALAGRLGMQPLSLRSDLSVRDRALYHAVAALVANDLLAVLALGAELLVGLGAERKAAERALAHLAGSAAANIAHDGSIAAALTGPVVRGDADTVARHIRALQSRSAAAARVYGLLSLEILDVAVRAGRLAPSDAAELRRILPGGRSRRPTV